MEEGKTGQSRQKNVGGWSSTTENKSQVEEVIILQAVQKVLRAEAQKMGKSNC